MKKTGGFGFSALGTRILHIIIYLIFLIYSVYFVITANTTTAKITYSVLAFIMLAVVIYYEYLQYQYEQAIKALNYDCDPEKGKLIFDNLQKRDLVHGFKNQRVIYDVLYNLAMYNSPEVISIINNNNKIFRGDLDQLFIRNVSLFLAYVEAGNRTAAKKAYPDVIKLKGTKIKGKKLAKLYNWDELEALHYYVLGDNKKAVTSYEKVNPAFMNNREATQYYYYYALSLRNLGKTAEASVLLNNIVEIANKLPVKQKAQELL